MPERQAALRDIQQRLYDILRSAPRLALNADVDYERLNAAIDALVSFQGEIDCILRVHGIVTMSAGELEGGALSAKAQEALS